METRREEINIENKELKFLLNIIQELTLKPERIFLKEIKIAIPNKLLHRVIKLALKNHLGVAKTIALLKEKFISLI